MGLFNDVFGWYLKQRISSIEHFMKNPIEVQEALLQNLIRPNIHTKFGKKYGFSDIKNSRQFAENVPIHDYDSLKPYINKMMHGESDVLWNGTVKWYSKSSGTTSDKSKFIPVTAQNLKDCHLRGSWDSLTMLYNNKENSDIFSGKNLVMGGSLSNFSEFPKSQIGDVSAIMLYNMPSYIRQFYAPSLDIGLMSEWEQKIELMAQQTKDQNIIMIGGVPTWTVVLFRRLLEITGASSILEVWPNFQTYIHGGVSFTPYRDQFKDFLPSGSINYLEIYNASEGYFAIQNDLNNNDLLLLLNNGMYFEFLPMDEWESDDPKAVPLAEVEKGKNYALIVSTNSGLWRYMPGDTVIFTETFPFKIIVSGRTKQFVNAFGEEVIVCNTDTALALTCQEFDAVVTEYTVAPIYFTGSGKAGHEWLIEFEKEPQDLDAFSKKLDKNLQGTNSDYEAKRYRDLALVNLAMHNLPKGSFHNWMKKRGKLGGQNKVPRLANHRTYLEEILEFAKPI